MGGNAFKTPGLEPKRISQKDFELHRDKILEKISGIFDKAQALRCYSQKQDHGDIDLIALETQCQNWQDKVALELQPYAKVWNKPTASFCLPINDPKGKQSLIQLDITITHSPQQYQTTKDYGDFSPLGNVLGKLIRTTGAKWGSEGLSYIVENELGQPIEEIELTKSMDKILEFCGLDPLVWHKGFQNQEDIFHYITQCHFFHKSAFETLNHKTRKRDKTRPDYHNWTHYLQDNKPQDQTILGKTQALEYLYCHFPELREKSKDILKKDSEIRLAKKTKFNGELIQEWTGVAGPTMGQAIADFKSKFPSKEAFETWLLNTPAAQVKRQFIDELKPNIE